MNISDNGLRFIQNEEGFRDKAYTDSVGVWTIGYGTTYYENGQKVKKGDTITKSEADRILKKQILTIYEPVVKANVKKPITQNQHDALVSLCYNIGGPKFRSSTLLKKINTNPNSSDIDFEFRRWRYAGNQPILLNRRIRESQLYFSSGFTARFAGMPILVLIISLGCILMFR